LLGVKVGIGMSVGIVGVGTLDLLPDHTKGELFLAVDEHVVVVGSIIVHSFASDAMESIDVQLPLKGLVMGLFEVTWHNVHGKFARFVHSEGLAVRLPRDNVLLVTPHYVVEHFVKFVWKGKLRRGKERC
jgi:hypothetical protein